MRACNIHIMSLWSAYVRDVMGEDTQTVASARTHIAQPTIGRWVHGTKAPTEVSKVAAFAAGYGRNVLEAMVAAGMLTVTEANRGISASEQRYLHRLSSS